MTEERLVDAIRDQAERLMRNAGIEEPTASALAEDLVWRIREEWGGDRHRVHAISATERARKLAQDPRPPALVAQDHGVAVSTVYRAKKRRIISSGVR